MKKHEIGPVLLSGLIIGPILGSGIVILPPLAYNFAGDWALPAWIVTVMISMLFAWVFGRLSILFPGDAGVAAAIETAFGGRMKNLTSFYLIGAVLFGPVAVILTAVEYLPLGADIPTIYIALPLLCATALLLLREISAIGRISLVMSSLAACTLFAGGIETLLSHEKTALPLTDFSPDIFGYTLLLLFWSVVGWEVIGNYSGDIRDPEKTLPQAIIGSAGIIALVTLTVAAAIQLVDPPSAGHDKVSVTAIIRGGFGNASPLIMAILTLALCVSTYLLFVGGVARLIASLASGSGLSCLAAKSANGAPVTAIAVLTGIHAGLLILVHLHLINIEQLVAVANGFFLSNALIGILAAVKLLPGRFFKITASLLALTVTAILLQSSIIVLTCIICCALFFLVGIQKIHNPQQIIPFPNQDENAKASEQRRDRTYTYGEEPHSAADKVNA